MNLRQCSLLGLAMCAVFSAAVFSGCATPPEPIDTRVPSAAVVDARKSFEAGMLKDAIIKCTELQRDDPLTPGLAELQGEITQRLAELRKVGTAARQPSSEAIALEDTDRQGILPETYRMRRHVVGESKPIHALPVEMQNKLDAVQDFALDSANLQNVIEKICNIWGVNIIGGDLLSDASMSLNLRQVSLREVLEYVGQHFSVTFAVGRNMIWITNRPESDSATPLFTRIYRLRKGISKEEIDGGPDSLGIIEAVKRFVPEVAGADIIFNPRAHAILAKNTTDNLALIEDIIEVLDVRPPQVLIEARFISTGVKDIRELGIDWLMKSDYAVSTRNQDGTRRASVQINSGAGIQQTGFANGTSGLNFTYEGLLTVPAFEAVVHALETSGNTRTLSVPRVTAVNNKEAKLRIGEDFRYFEDYDVEEIRTGTNDNGNETYESRLVPTGTPSLEELGIELVVMPSVGSDLATINLKLMPEISEFVRWEYYETASDSSSSDSSNSTNALSMIKLPIFRKSLVDTEVIVRSGETVVMGGLVTSSRVKSESGVPFLSKIPFIGRLFRHDVWEDSSQNLLIFVTSTLISDSGEELIQLNPPEPVTGDGKVELGAGKSANDKSVESAAK